MKRLFSFIAKNYFFFLFLFLELVAFSFVVQNSFQRATFLNATNKLTGSVFAAFNNITDYLTLKKANQDLAKENARLHNLLSSSFLYTDTLVYYRKDSLFSYISAKVISNSVNKQKNYLMLDKGSRQGIKKEMGVITTNGVVGTVVEVSEHFSWVMSILHINNRINARIKKDRHLGNLEWDGLDYRRGLLTDIPPHIELVEGDTIITSGNSLIFPEGILIGTVNNYYTGQGEKFNTALINFSVDYNSLYYVYVIVDMMKNEQMRLKSSTNSQ